MSSAFQRRIRDWPFLKRLVLGVVTAYVATVGVLPAMLRHTGDNGRFQWLPTVPGAVTLLQVYEWPAQQLSRIPLFHSVFELSASFWWTLLDPPDTTA